MKQLDEGRIFLKVPSSPSEFSIFQDEMKENMITCFIHSSRLFFYFLSMYYLFPVNWYTLHNIIYLNFWSPTGPETFNLPFHSLSNYHHHCIS